jgi:hypothetical protein
VIAGVDESVWASAHAGAGKGGRARACVSESFLTSAVRCHDLRRDNSPPHALRIWCAVERRFKSSALTACPLRKTEASFKSVLRATAFQEVPPLALTRPSSKPEAIRSIVNPALQAAIARIQRLEAAHAMLEIATQQPAFRA